jgi:histidinol-phosphatase
MNTESSEYQPRLEFALSCAEKASELILKHYQDSGLDIELKQDESPVTVADRGAEELIRSEIVKAFPEDGILGEEFDDKESQNGYQWIIDPIDGTKSFIHGVPLFGTLIGIEKDGEMVVGVCRFPGLNEVYYAATGSGSWWKKGNGEPKRCQVSKVSDLSKALFCVTTVTGWEVQGYGELFDTLKERTGLTRGWGDCYGHMLVASGRAELIVEPVISPWDVAALVPILQEAGGHYVAWDGTVDVYQKKGLSVNDALLKPLMDLIPG